MSEIVTEPNDAKGRLAQSQRFDSIAISLHWLTLVLIIAQFSAGWLHVALIGQSRDALQWPDSLLVIGVHRSLGMAIWLLAAGRIIWRVNFASLPPFPKHMSKFQQRLTTANEYALYALLLLQPLTGLAQFIFRGRPFSLFFVQLPAFVQADMTTVAWVHELHRLGAYVLLALIGSHAVVVVFHQYVLRDNILQRMLIK